MGAGIKTKEEARAELGLAPEPMAGAAAGVGSAPAQVGKYNPTHDERGRFSTSENAGPAGSKPPPIVRPTGEPTQHATPTTTVAQDLTQSCSSYIAGNRRASILRVFPGQFLTQSHQDVLRAAKSGDAQARTACELLFSNEYAK